MDHMTPPIHAIFELSQESDSKRWQSRRNLHSWHHLNPPNPQHLLQRTRHLLRILGQLQTHRSITTLPSYLREDRKSLSLHQLEDWGNIGVVKRKHQDPVELSEAISGDELETEQNGDVQRRRPEATTGEDQVPVILQWIFKGKAQWLGRKWVE